MHRPPRKKQPGDNGSGEPGEAEFQRDWKVLGKRFPWLADERLLPPGEEDDPDVSRSLATSGALCRFYRKHRARLQRKGMDVEDMLAKTVAATADLREKARLEGIAIDADLQAQANLAEAQANLVESLYGVMLFWESQPESAWESLEPTKRAEQWQLMTDLRAGMPARLAALPLERRRKLESMTWEEFERLHGGETPPPNPPPLDAP